MGPQGQGGVELKSCWSVTAWVQILTLWFISCVPFNKALTALCFSVFLLPSPCLIGVCEERGT